MNTINCQKCNHILSKSDMWINDTNCSKHKEIILKSSYKYDCPKCNHYEPWFTLSSSMRICPECTNEKINNEIIYQRYEAGEKIKDYDLIDVIECDPAIYVYKIIFGDNSSGIIETGNKL